MLEVGSKAPDFTLQDQDGNLHSLSDYKGQKVLLYFYPKDNTAGCTKQACAYSQLKSEFLEKGIQIIGLSKDSVKSHKNFEQKQNLDITLLSDENLDVISSYDVWHEKKMCGKTYMGVVRTTYVIDENGIIIFSNNKVKAAQDAQFVDLPGLHDSAEHRSVFIVSDTDAYIGKAEPCLLGFICFLQRPFPVRKMEIHLIDPGLSSELGLIDPCRSNGKCPFLP